ncbi:MAG: PepSY domain-containing protein [Sphingomonadaceae bacterium]
MRLIMMAAALWCATGALSAGPRGTLDVVDAVALAEKRLHGTVLEVESDHHKGEPVYEIEMIRGDTIHNIVLHRMSGELLSDTRPRLRRLRLRWFRGDEFRRLASIRLAPRLMEIGRRIRGRVTAIDYTRHDGEPWYDIRIESAAGVAEVRLDPFSSRQFALSASE